MSFKLHLIKVFMQIRCNFPDISYLSETQKNNFQFLNKRSRNPVFSMFGYLAST